MASGRNVGLFHQHEEQDSESKRRTQSVEDIKKPKLQGSEAGGQSGLRARGARVNVRDDPGGFGMWVDTV